jgi:hypothetical protein
LRLQVKALIQSDLDMSDQIGIHKRRSVQRPGRLRIRVKERNALISSMNFLRDQVGAGGALVEPSSFPGSVRQTARTRTGASFPDGDPLRVLVGTSSLTGRLAPYVRLNSAC